jgi:DNA-binding FrmR family transcriptional regulator
MPSPCGLSTRDVPPSSGIPSPGIWLYLPEKLRRIEGQVRGLQRMVDEDKYCIEVLPQISAVTKALEAVALTLLEGHLHHCVSEAIVSGGPEAQAKITEASDAIRRLVRS